MHGSVRHSLAWSGRPEEYAFDPLLVQLAEGLPETQHPLPFVARMGFRELLESPGAAEKAIPLVARVVPALRSCLASSQPETFSAGLDALAQFSACVGPALNSSLRLLLGQVRGHSITCQSRDCRD